MSTVPKLTYAKIGKSAKVKAESVSSQLLRSKQEKSDDLFKHMNQENLNYIKKQLKLKKNRSDRERSLSPHRDPSGPASLPQDQLTQRNKIFQKYRGDEEVSQKDPHLQDTERRSQQEKPLDILLPEEIEEDYHLLQHGDEKTQDPFKQAISSSHQGVHYGKVQEKNQMTEHKMYHSLPYEQGKKRIASIQGFFGEAVSTNLNRQDGQFIQFLQEYISDLHQSKHLKSRQNDEISIEKKRTEQMQSQRKRTISREESQRKEKNKVQFQFKEDLRQYDRLQVNSDTFGEPNSKFSVHSSNNSINRAMKQLERQLKQQKLNSLILAQQIEKLRNMQTIKQEVIKKIETDNDLLREELRHVKIQQQIINKGKTGSKNTDYTSNYGQFNKLTKKNNNQNDLKINDLASISHNHQRHASTNPNRTTQSYRSSNKQNEDAGDLFQQFAPQRQNYEASKEKKAKKDSESLEKWQQQYNDFLLQEKRNQRYRRALKKGREGIL